MSFAETAFFLKKLLAGLVLPPAGPLIVAAIGLYLGPRRPRIGRVLAWAGVLSLAALSLPVVSEALQATLADAPPLADDQTHGAQAIVIIAGGIRAQAPEFGGDTLGRLTLERVRYGARVARRTGLPVLVSGGAVERGEPEAVLMKAALEREFGVPVRWLEASSRNTRQNAVYSVGLLQQAGVEKVVLVAHSFDMRRARAEFSAAGMQTVAAPTGLPNPAPGSLSEWRPAVAALERSYLALYEMLAGLARALGAN